MKLEDIVCTLEQAQYFQKHGLFQDSIFVSVKGIIFDSRIMDSLLTGFSKHSVPTAEEILEVLPVTVKVEGDDLLCCLHVTKDAQDHYLVSYENQNVSIDVWGNSETHALADMVIHLHKNKLLTQ
jgi:hypothetical protein